MTLLDCKFVSFFAVVLECAVAELDLNLHGLACGDVHALEALEGLDGSLGIVESLDVNLDDLVAVAPQANMRERKARQVIDQVRAAVADWSRFAAEAEVKDEFVDKIGRVLAA